jgi:hypothetical protein
MGPELFYRTSEGVTAADFTVNGGAFAPSKPRLWAAKKDLGEFFALAPDGKRFAVVQPEASEGATHVTFPLNFFEELRRRAPVEK